MTLVTLLPSSTVSNTGGSIVGAATVHQAWNDSSDSSYVEYQNNENSRVHLDDITLPAGAAFVRADAIVRVAGPVRSTKAEAYAISGTVKATKPYQLTASSSTPVNVPVGVDDPVTVPAWTDPIIDALQFQVGKPDASVNGALLRCYRAWLEVRYAAAPAPTVTAPTGTLTTNNLPTIVWTPGLDAEGGALARTQVKIFSAAQYGAGGFDPETSTPTAVRTVTDNADLSWTTPIALANATYRAYIKVSQIVRGAYHSSAWVFGQFIINTTPPGAPTLAFAPNNATGAIAVTVTAAGGSPTTDAFELERSDDGGSTWVPVRNSIALGGVIPTAGGVVTDYEAPNGVTVQYRARGLHNYSGTYGAGAWTTSSTSWSSTSWWLKHPNLPARSLVVMPVSFPTVERESRHGVFQPLGATLPIVVSDTRAGPTGPIVFRTDTAAARDALDDLLALTDTFLLQAPLAAGEPDRYVQFGNTASTRLVDNQGFPKRNLPTTWIEVGQPIGPSA